MSYYEVQEDEAIGVVTLIAGPNCPHLARMPSHYNVRVFDARRR
jgi:hypothetical protein